VSRQGSPHGLEGVIVEDMQTILALDFKHYMTLKLVYVTWFEQVYPRDRRPLVVSDEEIAAGRHLAAKRSVLAIPTEAIEEFENVEAAWDGELNRRGLGEYIDKRKPESKLHRSQSLKIVANTGNKFSFVHDAKLRSLVERDFADLREARVWGSSRLRFILAGSLVEALLLDALMANASALQTAAAKKESRSLEYWSLGGLLEAAAELKLVSPIAEKLSDPVRELRNFVHPGVEWRSTFVFESEEVEIVERILDLVIRDLSRLPQLRVQP
jgi:hypothetical protein